MSRKTTVLDIESAVRERYENAAQVREVSLCCPATYDPKLLHVIPREILEKDYGCGDPSRYLCEGDIVLDLGSGGGKICHIAAQLVGPQRRVIGVDFNPEMLALARRYQGEVAERIGFDNVRFLRGRIQDLGVALDEVDGYLKRQNIRQGENLLHQ